MIPSATELRQFARSGEDDDADLCVTEHRELVGLLEQSVAALGEGDLAARRVLDPTDGDAPADDWMVAIRVRVRVRVRVRMVVPVLLVILGWPQPRAPRFLATATHVHVHIRIQTRIGGSSSSSCCCCCCRMN